jgi:hypothetical protein
MSVRVQSKVWEHSRATGNTLIVLLKLADNCDDQGRNAWPSVSSLSRYCRCSESTVHRAITELQQLGELVVVRNGGGGPHTGTRYAPNLYRVVIEGYQSDSPQLPSGVSNSGLRGVRTGVSGVPRVTPNSPYEPSRTAAESNFELSRAHLCLAREALGIGEAKKIGTATDETGDTSASVDDEQAGGVETDDTSDGRGADDE